MDKRKLLEYGGIASGVILIAFGIGAVVMSINGHNTVVDSLKAEKITKEATDRNDPVSDRRGCEASGASQHDLAADLQRRGQGHQQLEQGDGASPSTCASTRSSRRAA